jgi:hypothetical protein
MLYLAGFDETRFADNATKESGDGTLVKGPAVGLTDALDYFALARPIANRQPRVPLRFPDLDGEPCPQVQKAQQLSINRVYFRPPVLNTHRF